MDGQRTLLALGCPCLDGVNVEARVPAEADVRDFAAPRRVIDPGRPDAEQLCDLSCIGKRPQATGLLSCPALSPLRQLAFPFATNSSSSARKADSPSGGRAPAT